MKLTASTLPLGKLILSPLNARPRDLTAADVGDLIPSIRSKGLINPLTIHVLTKPKGKHGVLAGQRRWRALLELASDPSIDAAAIPVMIAEGTELELRELSIHENEQREDMDEVELLRSMKLLRKADPKVTDEQLAVNLGVSQADVRRIMRLAALHVDILNAYGQGHISPEMARAYAANDDTAEQIKAYHHVMEQPTYNRHVSVVRRFYGFGTGHEVDAMLAVIGSEKFTNAGGKIVQDLFSNAVKLEGEQILRDLYVVHTRQLVREYEEKNPNVRLVDDTELPTGRYGGSRDWDLAIKPEGARSPEDTAAYARAETAADAAREMLNELVDEASIPEDMFDDDTDEALIAMPSTNPARSAELAADLKKFVEEMAAIDAKPIAMPDAQLLGVWSVKPEGLQVALYWPSREAAGLEPFAETFTSHGAAAKSEVTKAAAALGIDLEISQRAQDEIKIERRNMIGRHLFGEGASSESTRATAADAFTYATARDLWTDAASKGSGFNHMYAGSVWRGIGKTEHFDPRMDDVPGLSDEDIIQGFWRYHHDATPEQKAWVGAACFYARVEGQVGSKRTLVNSIMSDLQQTFYARRAWTPTREFFGLFKKAKVLEWLGSIHDQFRLDNQKRKTADLMEMAEFFFRADEASVKRYGINGQGVLAKVQNWIPEYLRFKPVDHETGTLAEVFGREDQDPNGYMDETMPLTSDDDDDDLDRQTEDQMDTETAE